MILHIMFLPGSFERYIVVDTGNNYTITTRHHHHIFKPRPRTTFSSKLPNHNFVNIWNEIDENLKLCSSNVMFKQLLRKCYKALHLSHLHCPPDVWSTSAKTCDGSDHKQWNHSIMRSHAFLCTIASTSC